MFYFNKRLGELYLEGKKRTLTGEEQSEMRHCLEMNMKMMLQIENLKSLSLLATDTEDYDWLHQITAELDKLYEKSLLN